MTENKPIGIILIHMNTQGGTAFDFLVRKDKVEGYQWLKEDCYTAEDCPYVKKWLQSHQDYEYVASEDLEHIPSINAYVIELINRLKEEGFKEEHIYEADER